MTPRHDDLIRLAVRIWTTAETLDAIHGGDTVWRWTHEQVARLMRLGRHEDPDALEGLARALERRLERDRSGEVEA